MAVGQLDTLSQLLPTACWRCPASVSRHQVHIRGTWSVCCVGLASEAIARRYLQVRRYEVSYAMADESAACVCGMGWPEWVHHLRNTDMGTPGPLVCFQQQLMTGLFPSSGKRVRTGRNLTPRPLQGVGEQAREREWLQGFLTPNRDTPMQEQRIMNATMGSCCYGEGNNI